MKNALGNRLETIKKLYSTLTYIYIDQEL